jgi:hypothetical protein
MPPQLFAFGTFAVLALLAMMLLLDVMTGANVVIELGAVPALPSGLPPEFICREGELVSCANLAITEEIACNTFCASVFSPVQTMLSLQHQSRWQSGLDENSFSVACASISRVLPLTDVHMHA